MKIPFVYSCPSYLVTLISLLEIVAVNHQIAEISVFSYVREKSSTSKRDVGDLGEYKSEKRIIVQKRE